MQLSLITPILLLLLLAIGRGASSRTEQAADITPIPMENLNPRLTEFRRIDTNQDEVLSFGEFLLSDKPYVEQQSRRFHQLDANGDGRISRNEHESFYRDRDEDFHQKLHTDFFRQLGPSLYTSDSAGADHHRLPLLPLFNFPTSMGGGQQSPSVRFGGGGGGSGGGGGEEGPKARNGSQRANRGNFEQ